MNLRIGVLPSRELKWGVWDLILPLHPLGHGYVVTVVILQHSNEISNSWSVTLLTFQSPPELCDFSWYNIHEILPSHPDFKPKPWTWFTPNQKTRCYLKPTPPFFCLWNVWLIVQQLPIKAIWWDAPLTLRDFSRSNKHAPNIHPHVFNSFHRTILHIESHSVFTCPSPSNDVSPHITIEPRPSVPYLLFLY